MRTNVLPFTQQPQHGDIYRSTVTLNDGRDVHVFVNVKTGRIVIDVTTGPDDIGTEIVRVKA